MYVLLCTLYVHRNVKLGFLKILLKNILNSACMPVVKTASGGGGGAVNKTQSVNKICLKGYLS